MESNEELDEKHSSRIATISREGTVLQLLYKQLHVTAKTACMQLLKLSWPVDNTSRQN